MTSDAYQVPSMVDDFDAWGAHLTATIRPSLDAHPSEYPRLRVVPPPRWVPGDQEDVIVLLHTLGDVVEPNHDVFGSLD